jgi:CDP-glycerol glycerophosphotransferase (TagB/SpsB family)
MSAVRWLRELGAFALSLLGAALGWLLLAPIALLVPKRRNWIAVIGRQHGRFLDNAKYFFLDASCHCSDMRVVFISEDMDTVDAIANHGLRALHYPSPGSVWYLLRCGCVVVDSTDWIRHLRRFLLIRARVIQIWHGVAFKRIELDKWRHETGRYRWLSGTAMRRFRLFLYRFSGRVVRYAAVCSTSVFYRDAVFVPAFLAYHFPITGYPRNGFACELHGKALDLAWHNADAQVRSRIMEWSDAGKRLILIVPTMRDSLKAPMELDAATMQRLDMFAALHGFEFLFKFHPSERNTQDIMGEHLHVCAPNSDVYPLLPHCDALVTDYSSIYMDFLLLDRPVLFLITDGDSYLHEDREVQFDPASMMPGAKLASWEELLDALINRAPSEADGAERARLRKMAFDNLEQSGSTMRLLDFMWKQGWLPGDKPSAVASLELSE